MIHVITSHQPFLNHQMYEVDTKYLLARKSEDTKFKINSIFNGTFFELLGRFFSFFDKIQ